MTMLLKVARHFRPERMLGPNERPKNRAPYVKHEICPKISSVNDAKFAKSEKIETCAESQKRQKSEKNVKNSPKIGKKRKIF